MFTDYEALTCQTCGRSFMGRKPAEGGGIFCPTCLQDMEEKVVNPEDTIPQSVLNEMSDGRGEDE